MSRPETVADGGAPEGDNTDGVAVNPVTGEITEHPTGESQACENENNEPPA